MPKRQRIVKCHELTRRLMLCQETVLSHLRIRSSLVQPIGPASHLFGGFLEKTSFKNNGYGIESNSRIQYKHGSNMDGTCAITKIHKRSVGGKTAPAVVSVLKKKCRFRHSETIDPFHEKCLKFPRNLKCIFDDLLQFTGNLILKTRAMFSSFHMAMRFFKEQPVTSHKGKPRCDEACACAAS